MVVGNLTSNYDAAVIDLYPDDTATAGYDIGILKDMAYLATFAGKTNNNGSIGATNYKVQLSTRWVNRNNNYYNPYWNLMLGEARGKHYRARFICLYTGGNQNLIFYGATEATSTSLNVAKKGMVGFDGDNPVFNSLSGIKFTVQKENGQYVNVNGNSVTYSQNAQEFTTGNDGKFTIQGLDEGKYIVNEISGNVDYYQDTKEKTINVVRGRNGDTLQFINYYKYGNLKIVKKDNQNTNVNLGGIKFKIQKISDDEEKQKEYNMEYHRIASNFGRSENEGKYIKLDNEKVVYVDNEKDATEFVTDENGEINVSGLVIGNYKITETETDNAHILNQDGYYVRVLPGTDYKTEYVLTNERKKTINITGLVWKDERPDKKENEPVSGQYDGKETLLSADEDKVEVKLVYTRDFTDARGITHKEGDLVINETGDECYIIAREQTSEDNLVSYKFENVYIDELDYVKIIFVYNGFEYENVKLNNDPSNSNGSKASEKTRIEFNNEFENVTGNTENEGNTKGHSLKYEEKTRENGNGRDSYLNEIDKGKKTGYDYVDTLAIEADTENDYIKNRYNYLSKNGDYPISEITYINLGVYERAMPDLSIDQVLYNTKITINGYEHTYLYDNKDINEGEYTGGFNVGVEFGKRYGNGYVQPVYKSDFSTYKKENKDERLKIYLTYAIDINNMSTAQSAKVHNIINYYDSNYDIVKIGTKIDENTKEISDEGIIEKEPEIEQGGIYNENNKYKKKIIDLPNETIKGTNSGVIFIQYKLNDEAAIGMINRNETEPVLKNVVEIGSYTMYDGENIYAGIDKNSNPGNAIPGEQNTYENDTSEGQDVKLSITQERTISGVVFEDKAEDDKKNLIKENNQGNADLIEGNGQLDDYDTKINNVKVHLVNKKDGTDYEAKTKDGIFNITGFTPGEYEISYTWGDENYNVIEYKATIFNDDTHKDKYWWRTNNSDSDAKDDYEERLKIDNREKDENEMTSTSDVMDIGIEYTDNIKSIEDVRLKDGKIEIPSFEIQNINFGIIERPKLNLETEKRVTHFKITYPNGQVLTDTDVEYDEGKNQYNLPGVHIGMSCPPRDSKYGLIRQEMDNELIQGSNMEVTYKVVIKNNSDLDYANEKFYNHGYTYGYTKYGNDIFEKPVTIEPVTVTDYLDNEFEYDANLQNQEEIKWKVVDSYNEESFDPRGTEKIKSDTGWNEIESIDNKEENYTLKRYRREWSEEERKTGYRISSYRYQKTTTDQTLLEQYKNIRLELEGVYGLEAGDKIEKELNIEKRLTNSDDITFDNEAEVSEYKIVNGRVPNMSSMLITDFAEKIVITPSTGGNRNHMGIIVLSVSMLAILGAGIVLVKKKVLGK